MIRIQNVPVAILAVILASFLSLPGRAYSSHKEMVPPAKEVSVSATWQKISSEANRDLTGMPADEEKIAREMNRLADRLRPAVAAARGGEDIVKAFRSVLLKEEGFRYDPAIWKAENFLLGGVLATRTGNCLGLSLLWLSLAEKLAIPNFHGVYVPGHCFVRYDGGGVRINVEFAENGASWDDGRYMQLFLLPERGPYLRSLSGREMLGVLCKSVGASYTGKGRHMNALALYDAAEGFYPDLPDVHYNAGVSLQRMGQPEKAVEKYRKALALDRNMIVARGNLASSLSACGNYDEGIREFRTTVEQDPSNAKAREGLTRALYLKGEYREAARQLERAEEAGCRFDPKLAAVLAPYRDRDPEQASR